MFISDALLDVTTMLVTATTTKIQLKTSAVKFVFSAEFCEIRYTGSYISATIGHLNENTFSNKITEIIDVIVDFALFQVIV